jgi:hypothetical protein
VAAGRPSDAPTLLIELALEEPPRIRMDCASEGEQLRLLDWIAHRPALRDIVGQALDVAEERA